MGGCANVLFWLVLAACLAVILLAGEHNLWAALAFLLACGLAIAYNCAFSERW